MQTVIGSIPLSHTATLLVLKMQIYFCTTWDKGTREIAGRREKHEREMKQTARSFSRPSESPGRRNGERKLPLRDSISCREISARRRKCHHASDCARHSGKRARPWFAWSVIAQYSANVGRTVATTMATETGTATGLEPRRFLGEGPSGARADRSDDEKPHAYPTGNSSAGSRRSWHRTRILVRCQWWWAERLDWRDRLCSCTRCPRSSSRLPSATTGHHQPFCSYGSRFLKKFL